MGRKGGDLVGNQNSSETTTKRTDITRQEKGEENNTLGTLGTRDLHWEDKFP